MNFISYEDLARDAVALARRLPRDTVGVLGIPRSGMLAASIIAQELDCHLGDVYDFVHTGCAFMRPGRRMNWSRDPNGPVIVVDDSLYAGAAMDNAKAALRSNPMMECYYDYQFAAVYLAPGTQDRVHWFQREVELPRIFQWNWRYSDLLENAMVDMDGVLCEDPDCNDDQPERYDEFLECARPLYALHRKIGAIVTGRLEKFRGLTVNWLLQNKVRYDSLLMAPFDSATERRAYRAAKWKAEVYALGGAKLFVESEEKMAEVIATETGLPVLCTDTMRMY